MYCRRCGNQTNNSNGICNNCVNIAPKSDNTVKIVLIVLGSVIGFIALIVFSMMTINNTINGAKEAANLRSVEAYAKSIEYGVIQYEYKNNGKSPNSYCDVKQYLSSTNTDVVCDVTITKDEANVIVEHCKVGDYEKHSYRYDGSNKNNRGAEKEEVTRFAYPYRCF